MRLDASRAAAHVNALLIILCLLAACASASKKSTKELLDQAKAHLAQGQFNDAMNAFDLAIEQDPSNYMAIFRRAAAQLSVGKMSQALRDFDAVLKIRPDFDQALVQRGRILLKECRIDEALIDLKTYWLSNPKDEDILQLITDAESAVEDRKAVYDLVNTKQTEPALETLSRLVIICPLYVDWRLMRSNLYLEANDLVMAASDLSRVAAIRPSTDIYHRIATLRLKMGELNDALGAIKDCMKHDPENRPCKTIFKQIRALDKAYQKVETLFSQSRWKSAVTELLTEKGYLELAEQSDSDALKLKAHAIACKSYFELNKNEEAEQHCTKVISLDESNFDALFMRGELRLRKEDYEDAVRDLEKAHHVNQQDRRVIESYQKAQRLLAQSKKKDYYKVLGVSRTASKRDIRKAYRTLAQEWHPDKYAGDLSEEQVLEKMSAINEAYEVLSDDEKRQQFDNGIDPNDQQQHQHHQQGGPQFFFQGGFPGGGFPGGGFPGGQQFMLGSEARLATSTLMMNSGDTDASLQSRKRTREYWESNEDADDIVQLQFDRNTDLPSLHSLKSESLAAGMFSHDVLSYPIQRLHWLQARHISQERIRQSLFVDCDEEVISAPSTPRSSFAVIHSVEMDTTKEPLTTLTSVFGDDSTRITVPTRLFLLVDYLSRNVFCRYNFAPQHANLFCLTSLASLSGSDCSRSRIAQLESMMEQNGVRETLNGACMEQDAGAIAALTISALQAIETVFPQKFHGALKGILAVNNVGASRVPGASIPLPSESTIKLLRSILILLNSESRQTLHTIPKS
ncbi:hypothetical protein HDU84_003205 [Entophlyctis sp. JEL0112]|nr:hypothetical protein HDU84_003205 [Entophlyctis sp. JEL0112]